MNNLNEDALAEVRISYNPSAKHKTGNRGFQGIPGLEAVPEGRLWATWYSGGLTEGPENFVLLVTSADKGRTWSEPVAVIDPPGKVRAFDPVLWLDPSGRLWWFWSQSYSPEDKNIFDGKGGVWGACTEMPNASEPSFSGPVRIANGVMMNKPTVLFNGEWALPTAVWEYCGPKLDSMKAERFSNITISNDNGRTFHLRSGADVPQRTYDEHMIVELKDGKLWMLVRTRYGIGQSFSSDGGRSWSHAEDSRLGGPNSRFFIRRLSSGNLLMINHAASKRSHLTAFISPDDALSWSAGLLLDERDNVSYPDGAEDKNGIIRIIYDRERYKEGEILMAVFREEDVLGGKQVSGDFNLKMTVSKTGGVKK